MNVPAIMAHQQVRAPLPILIVAEVAGRRGLSLAELKRRTRLRRIAHPRQEAMYELLARTRLSTQQVARHVGVSDHTTVIYGADKHAERNGLPYIRELRAKGVAA